jgi:hypothetical protein
MIYVYPILILIAAFFLLVSQLRLKKGQKSSLDLGVVFVAILLVYGFMPGVGFLLAYLGIGQIMDQRLSNGFDVGDVEYIQWMHLLLVFGFSIGYFLKSRPATGEFGDRFSNDARHLVKPLIGLVLLVSFMPSLLIGTWGGEIGADYISSYTVLRSAPVLVQQVYGVLSQLQFSAIVALVVVFIAAKPEKHLWVAFALGLNMIFAALSGGSRTLAFLAFFSYIAASSILVRGFSWKRILLFALPALLLFMIGGMFRDKSEDAGLLYLFQTGEFTVLFVNAVDLKERFAAGWGEEVRFAFYFVDVLRLIPSQLLGGVKLDPAQWYAETFYPDYFDAGGGFAFGVLSECSAGFGAPEAFVRGLLLGLIFRFCRNSLMGPSVSVARIFIYVWMIALCYQSYRDTNFSLAVRALYQLLPVLVIIGLFSRRDSKAPKLRRVSA